MDIGDTYKASIFGLSIVKWKKVEDFSYVLYVLGIPLLFIRWRSRVLYVNFPFMKNIMGRGHNRHARNRILKKYRSGKPLCIALMATRPAMWGFNYLYKLLEKDPSFEVKVVVMPDVGWGKEAMIQYMDMTCKELTEMGYDPIRGYDDKTGEMLDFRKVVNPDIIFYTDFWKPHFHSNFYITEFLDRITFLIEYAYPVTKDDTVCVFELNRLVDIYFRPTPFHLESARQLMANKGANVKVVGAPKLDAIHDPNYVAKDVWKPQDKPKKRIIWAPHHQLSDSEDFYRADAFWYLYDYMLEVAERFKDTVQFVFRPHPYLYRVIVNKWGKEKADEYYRRWDEGESTQYYDGPLVDLFFKSDAMIMDSFGFMVEYTVFNKPLFHTATKTSRLLFTSEFNTSLYKNFYVPEHDLEGDIVKFIQEVVLEGRDVKAEQRKKYVDTYLMKIGGRSASENIYEEIKKFLSRKRV